MKQVLLVPALGLLMGLIDCDQAAWINRVTSPERIAAAKNEFELLRNHQFDAIEKDLDPSLKVPTIRTTLTDMAAKLPSQNPVSVKVVGANVFRNVAEGMTSIRTNLTFEYQFPDRWLLANVATQQSGAGTYIIGFGVTPIADSLENLNRFTLAGKKPIHFIALGLAFAVPLFILSALIACVRTPLAKRKWLWILFILLGVGQFSLNWTDGRWALGLLQVQLFGASAFAPFFGPWTLTVSLPLGASLFLLVRNRLPKKTS